jgi:hypothetical protein
VKEVEAEAEVAERQADPGRDQVTFVRVLGRWFEKNAEENADDKRHAFAQKKLRLKIKN